MTQYQAKPQEYDAWQVPMDLHPKIELPQWLAFARAGERVKWVGVKP